MRARSMKIIQYALLIFTLLNLAFIFIQSALPPEESSKESSAVGDIIEEIIPPDTKPGAFIQTNLRKIAHFMEFASLGAFVSTYLILFFRKRATMLLSFPTALLTGFIDETIQLFSGRGSSVKDVWIDFFGFVFASTLFYTAWLIIYLIRKNVNKNCHKTTTE